MKSLLILTAAASLNLGQKPLTSDWVKGDGNGQGTFAIDWSCGSRQSPDGLGILQDEYCEWDRKAVDFDQDLSTQTLTCEYRTSFDTKRQVWQPMRDARREFDHTQFNTNTALLQLIADCLSSSEVHCDKNKDPNKLVDCVPERASDPEVCRQLQRIRFVDKKSITPVPLPIPEGLPGTTLRKKEQKESSNPQVGIQLGIISPLPAFCSFDVDPRLKKTMTQKGWTAEAIETFAKTEKTFVRCSLSGDLLEEFSSCDAIAPQLRAGTVLKIGALQ